MSPARKVRVLFVCLGNACRSPMAESIARRHAADVIEASSAGLYPLGYVADATVDMLLANGYSVEGLSSKSLSRDAVRQADLIINLTGGPMDFLFSAPPCNLRKDQKLEDWEVPDPYGQDAATYQGILEEIESRVIFLANRLRAEERTADP